MEAVHRAAPSGAGVISGFLFPWGEHISAFFGVVPNAARVGVS